MKITHPTTAAALARRFGISPPRVHQLREKGSLVAVRSAGTWIFCQDQADQFFRPQAERQKRRVDGVLARLQEV